VTLDYARDLWTRARNALKSAELLVNVSADDAASALRDQTFRRHGAVRAAVHREWVKTGIWSVDLGADFDAIWELRDMGDYGGRQHVATEDAVAAVEAARRILDAVRLRFPDLA
jgi:uncharacterized protein (UPF0332 family)